MQHPEEFWRRQAEQIRWFKEPEEILCQDSDGHCRWFRGGKLNTSYLALDFHVEQGRGEQLALIYDSPVTGAQRSYTYRATSRRGRSIRRGTFSNWAWRRGYGRDLHADDPRDDRGHACLRRIGGDSFGGLRGIRGARIGDPDRRCAAQSSADGQRRQRSRPSDRLSVDCRRGACSKQSTRRSDVLSCSAIFIGFSCKAGRDLDWEEISQRADAGWLD